MKRKETTSKNNENGFKSFGLYVAIGIFMLAIAFFTQNYFKDAQTLAEQEQKKEFETSLLQQLTTDLNNKIMNKPEKIKQPAVAGAFYPSEKSDLQKTISDLLELKQTEIQKHAKALIIPHAGYIFSGPVAASGYNSVQNNSEINKVFVLGPSHYVQFTGVALSDYDYFKTPLGKIKLSSVNKDLQNEKLFEVNDDAFEQEHSIEVQLPFLQTVVTNDFEIIPIVVGEISLPQAKELAAVLERYLDENSLVVVSSDLSHYKPYDTAVSLDQETIENIKQLDSEKLQHNGLCGKFPAMVLIELAKILKWDAELMEYKNSGDILQDKEKDVVGYASMVFFEKEIQDLSLNSEEQSFLLQSASDAIENYLNTGQEIKIETQNKNLLEKKGVFVTLNKNDQLRGCIGYIEPQESIIDAVVKNAISAAFFDPRFTPVTKDEFGDLKIEISVLSELKKSTYEQVRQGEDGVIVQKGINQATYLPQVWQDFPDKQKFFESLCQKAGIDSQCLQDNDLEVYTYQVMKF